MTTRYRVIAPDIPGFGFTTVPEERGYRYAKDIQLDLFLDYASNSTLDVVFQDYFRDANPPLLAIWGQHDPFFIPPGAGAFRRDNPEAMVELLDTGHFALETHVDQIALAMHRLLSQAQSSH